MTENIHRNIPDNRGNSAYTCDPELARMLGIYMEPSLREYMTPAFEEMGTLVGDELETLALEADKNPPVLHLRNRNGADAPRIEKHPSYRRLEHFAYSHFGLAAMSHRGGVLGWPDPLPPIAKYALTYLFVQAEFGLCCPLSMTDALTRTLRKFGDPELVARYIDNLTSQDEAKHYQGAMFMTEQDAGSDVGAITTEAHCDDGTWRLYGDKWFCSNPDAELAMVLARPTGGDGGTRGLTLFLLPRHLEDGSLNQYRILRLKDKMGTRSMASGEIVMEGAVAYVVGEQGSGFKQMTDMINMSRLSNGVRSAGMMRRSVNEALFFARNRVAFGRQLIDLPLMQRQLLKMLISAEQGRSMVFHTAECLRRADGGDDEAAKLLRILTPLIKFRTTRDARKVAGDGMEVRGGCGYIEEWSDARVLRDAHLGSIWEGTSNIVALDVFRAIRREQTLPALSHYLDRLLGEAGLDESELTTFTALLTKAVEAAERVAGSPEDEAEVRRIASALYHMTSAVFLVWESAQLSGDFRRLALAKLVLQYKLLPQDPLEVLAPDAQAVAELLTEKPLDRDVAARLVDAQAMLSAAGVAAGGSL